MVVVRLLWCVYVCVCVCALIYEISKRYELSNKTPLLGFLPRAVACCRGSEGGFFCRLIATECFASVQATGACVVI